MRAGPAGPVTSRGYAIELLKLCIGFVLDTIKGVGNDELRRVAAIRERERERERLASRSSFGWMDPKRFEMRREGQVPGCVRHLSRLSSAWDNAGSRATEMEEAYRGDGTERQGFCATAEAPGNLEKMTGISPPAAAADSESRRGLGRSVRRDRTGG